MATPFQRQGPYEAASIRHNVRPNRLYRYTLIFFLTLSSLSSAEPIEIIDYSPTIAAKATLDNHTAHVSWRLSRETPVDRIEASLRGTPLSVGIVETYPQPGDQTGILFLVDVSDPSRDPIIQKQILALIELLKPIQPHQHVALAEFASTFKIISGFSDSPNSLLPALAQLQAHGKTTELYRSVVDAIDFINEQPFTRKSIFVFSDGQAEDSAYRIEDVIDSARKSGIVINSLGYPAEGVRATALQSMRRMAEETGGQFITISPPDYVLPAAFLASPYHLLETGGRVSIKIDDPYALPLDPPAELIITLHYGSDSLSLKSHLNLRNPTSQELIDLAFSPEYHKFTVGSLAIGGVIALLIIFAFLRPLVRLLIAIANKLKRKEKPAPAPSPIAFLSALDSSEQQYPITQHSSRMGRNQDNEIILSNTSVSGNHACITLRRDGTFNISDLKSANGIRVNDEPVDEAILKEGDVIELGEVRLRFMPAHTYN